MFQFPEQTAVNRVLPKTKIYDKARPTKAIRDLFIAEVEQIVWKHKLSPDTLRLAPADGIQEIQLFEITLKRQDISLRVLETIDRAIPYPVFFRLCRTNRVQHAAAYKRPAQDGSVKWVIGEYYRTAWTKDSGPHSPLPLALNLKSLYDQMLRAFIVLPARTGESLPDLLARESRVRQSHLQIAQLQKKLRSEKQFNRKVAINADLRRLDGELQTLSSNVFRVNEPAVQ
jgi:hypothetical protein